MDYPSELAAVAQRHGEARAELRAVEADRNRLIRQAHKRGKLSVRQIAGHVGMSHQRVGQIVQRRT